MPTEPVAMVALRGVIEIGRKNTVGEQTVGEIGETRKREGTGRAGKGRELRGLANSMVSTINSKTDPNTANSKQVEVDRAR